MYNLCDYLTRHHILFPEFTHGLYNVPIVTLTNTDSDWLNQ